MVELTGSAAIFGDFPWPPSVNQSYAGKTRRYSAECLKNYKSAVHTWWMVNREMVHKVQAHFLSKVHDEGFVLAVHRFFYYRTSDLYTKDGRIKKNDVTNRIKCLDDSLTDILALDDRLIWEGSEKKCITKQKPYVKIILSPVCAEGCFNDISKTQDLCES